MCIDIWHENIQISADVCACPTFGTSINYRLAKVEVGYQMNDSVHVLMVNYFSEVVLGSRTLSFHLKNGNVTVVPYRLVQG